jgi:hypothetical protein
MENRELCEEVRDHGKRIVALEIRDAEQSVKIDNLVKSLNNLAGWIKALIITIFTASIGFFVWLMQYLITK